MRKSLSTRTVWIVAVLALVAVATVLAVLPATAKIDPPPPTAWFPTGASCPSGTVGAECCINTTGGQCYQEACIAPWLLGTICLPEF